jgi:hypothetical protein
MNPHDFFSTVEWDPEYSWFNATYRFDGFEVKVAATGESESDLTQLIRAANFLVYTFENIDSVLSVVSRDLLDTFNDDWNSGPKLTEGEFSGRITLENMSILGSGPCMEFADDGMLHGHSITVRCTEDFQPLSAHIEG